MKIKYRQSEKFGCGSYTLANIFDNPAFIAELPATQGERVADLNRKMDIYQPELFINPMFMSNIELPVGNKLSVRNTALFGYEQALSRQQKRELARPYIINIAKANGGLHSIGLIHDLYTRLFYVVDSGAEYVFQGVLLKILKQYDIVMVAQFSLWDCEDKANFLMMPRENFAHIFK